MTKEINRGARTKLNSIVLFMVMETKHVKLSALCCKLGIQPETFADLMEYNYSKFTMEQINSIFDKMNDYIQEVSNDTNQKN